MENLAAVALEAASRVHQRVQSGNNYGSEQNDSKVLYTAEAFYKWLQDKSL